MPDRLAQEAQRGFAIPLGGQQEVHGSARLTSILISAASRTGASPGIVVDDRRVLRPGQLAEQPAHMVVALASLAIRQVELQCHRCAHRRHGSTPQRLSRSPTGSPPSETLALSSSARLRACSAVML
jgi:hypothetical protein